MIPMIFSSLFITFSILVSLTSINGMYVNRTFNNFPIYIAERNVIKYVENDQKIIAFNELTFKEDTINYFTESLKNKVRSYQIGFYFFVIENGVNYVAEENKNNNVQIHFRCKFDTINSFDDYLIFSAKEIN